MKEHLCGEKVIRQEEAEGLTHAEPGIQAPPRQGRAKGSVLFLAGAAVPLALIGARDKARPMAATLSKAGTAGETKERENG